MNQFINFIVESGISLSLFGMLYYLFLRKETFFLQNRLFLFATILFSVVLPLLHIRVYADQLITLPEITVTPKSNYLYALTAYSQGAVKEVEQTISSSEIVLWGYSVVALFLALRLLAKCVQIYNLKRKGTLYKMDGISVVITDNSIAPFAFLNMIFIPQNLKEKEGYSQILLHEMEHVKQHHSYDILIVELLAIVQWCNPFVWLLKRAVHENHEYLADKAVLTAGTERGQYKLLLLNQCLGEAIFIASPFNYSLIKNRIKMMNKMKSQRIANLKYLLGVVVAGGLLVGFALENKLVAKQTKIATIQKKEVQDDDNRIFVVVEQEPEYEGGLKALLKFVSKEIKYPKEAADKNIQGRVYLKFVVKKDGKIGEVIVLRSPHKLLSDEAVRVVKMLSKFKPGMQRGKPINVWYQLPVTFRIDDKKTEEQNDENPIFVKVEQMPQYEGGTKALLKFLAREMQYPKEAADKKIQGRVYLKFVVKKDGTIGKVVVQRSPNKLLSDEAVRVVKMIPKFKPGMQRGKPVNVWYQLPLTFRLGETKTEVKITE